MVERRLLFVFAIAITTGHAQLADLLFPSWSNTVRGLSESLARQPIVRFASEASGDVITSFSNGLSAIPQVLARSLGSSSPLGFFPTLISNSNTLEHTDDVVSKYTAGLPNVDASLDITNLVPKYGFPMEHHETVTPDGYILSLFRIPNNGTVVFLMHGLLGSADDYVIAGPESGIAYLLAKEGYDVWMGNARGNKHSRQHVTLDSSEAQFWDFSWHEIGCYDLPSMIDYVLNETNNEALKYVGHSQGTTSFFVMTSEKPEYNKKISLMIALSPVAFMSHATSPVLRLLSPTNRLIHSFSKMIGIYEFLPDSFMVRMMKKVMCGIGPVSEILCSNVLFLIVGFGFDQLNVTNLPVIYGHVPSGAATKQFVHYAQGAISGEFRKYDYGPAENFERYGSEVPPQYALRNVVAPVSLFYSDADWLSHPTDVDKLYNELGNPIDIHRVPFKPFNHLDFIWGMDCKKYIHERMKKLMSHF